VSEAVTHLTGVMAGIADERISAVAVPIREAAHRIRAWRLASEQLAQAAAPGRRARLERQIRENGARAQQLADEMTATREPLVRPLVVILPRSAATAAAGAS
jgi:hypothetical protein